MVPIADPSLHRREIGRPAGRRLDLGATPLANAYVTADSLDEPELEVPLRVLFCHTCGLVQLSEVVPPEILFSHYVYVTGASITMVTHFRELAAGLVERLGLGKDDLVVEIASNDGTLLSGFTELGVKAVAEMNRVGIMVDVSHSNKATMMHAVRVSVAPVIASHSSCRALTDSGRNLDDEQLLALKANGGVIQMVALGGFVKLTPERDAAVDVLVAEMTGADGMRALFRRRFSASDEERAEIEQQLAAIRERIESEIDPVHPAPDIEDFVDHIDHAVQLIGIDHVGISSDFDGGGGIVGWNDASETFNVTRELVTRGYSEAAVRQLWGGNTLRVWRQVEDVARHLQAAAD